MLDSFSTVCKSDHDSNVVKVLGYELHIINVTDPLQLLTPTENGTRSLMQHIFNGKPIKEREINPTLGGAPPSATFTNPILNKMRKKVS